MQEIQLTFTVDKTAAPPFQEPTVFVLCPGEIAVEGTVCYPADCLSELYVDLICGRSLPTRLVLNAIYSVEQLFALAIFVDRELALNPKVSSVVSSIALVRSLGDAGLAHTDRDFCRLYRFLGQYFFSATDESRKIQQVLSWIRDYILHDKLPSMGPEAALPKILDTGSNGFVLAEIQDWKQWRPALIELYRLGHLRGAIFCPQGDRQQVAVFKKSDYLKFDLSKACHDLALSEAPSPWLHLREGLQTMGQGTKLSRDTIIQILIRA